MQPRTRIGLIVGVIGLVLNICVAGYVGLCGPLFSLVAGAAAGFFAAQQEKLPTKAEGARAGATAGGEVHYLATSDIPGVHPTNPM